MNFSSKNLLFIFISFFAILSGLAYFKFLPLFHSNKENQEARLTSKHFQQELWMTVFIHGTFHSGLSFLSYIPVSQDKIKNSTYRYVMQQIRKDPLFYQNQLILHPGLCKIEPTFDINAVAQKSFTAYPIIAMYQEILEKINPGHEKNSYYTFGWSGVISKEARRKEALYLYNALIEELKKFQAQGLAPKIRLVSFSHGGNVALNLGAVASCINQEPTVTATTSQKDIDVQESLQAMRATLANLPDYESVKHQIQNHPYKYTPTDKNLVIDELILFGVPIQPETDHFCQSPLFKKIFNFYSNEDGIQCIDWVSSKRPYADQRINVAATEKKYGIISSRPKIIQARIMIGRNIEKSTTDDTEKLELTKKQKELDNAPWWIRLFYYGNILKKKSADPTHREFWFTYWKRDGALAFLNPFPVVVLLPLILNTLHKTPNSTDIDVNIAAINQKLLCQIIEHHQNKIINEQTIPQDFLIAAQQKIEPWRPDQYLKKREFEILKKHMDDFLK